MKKGDIVKLHIEDVAFGSEGIARMDGKVVFIDRALPGEDVEARIIKERRDYVRAKIEKICQHSPHRQDFSCPHFPYCGGCKWQDVDYSYQLALKHHIVSETLKRLGNFEDVLIHHTVPSPELFSYRNKMEFSFSKHRWILPDEPSPLEKSKYFALGLHVPNRYDKVLDVDACWLQSGLANKILNLVQAFARSSGKPPWDFNRSVGFWRYLVIRKGINTNQTMVNIVTFEYDRELMEQLKQQLNNAFPHLTSVFNNVTQSKGGSAFGESEYLLAGKPYIEDKIGNLIFEISANSFFQTNTKQAERLYQIALEYAGLTSENILYDLYSGTGTISIFMAQFAKKVIGIEAIESAVQNARRNAERNGLENCQFILGDVRDELSHATRLTAEFGKPDVLIVDPPRAGIHPKAIQGILDLKPDRIVYLSCNSATFARDTYNLCKTDYRLRQVQPVDMFPHTAHVELVASLQRNRQYG